MTKHGEEAMSCPKNGGEAVYVDDEVCRYCGGLVERTAALVSVLVGPPPNGTGLQYVEGRQQPFTVWFEYWVDGFEETIGAAYDRLWKALEEG